MSENPGGLVPSLDTIEFEQLVELGRAQIPRHAPEWTDHNLHDPGMTLLDLLAWIVDQQVYRAGAVGSRHRTAFAALLGQRPEGPRPAAGLIWPHRRLDGGRLVQEGAEIRCDVHRTLGFVLAREVYLTPAALVRAHLTVDGAEVPALPSDLDTVTWVLGDARPLGLTALTLGFDQPLGRAEEAVPVAFGFDVAPPPGPPPGSGDVGWGPVTYEYRVGQGQPWARVPVAHDDTAGLALPGHVVLRIPRTEPGQTGGSGLRISFERGFFPAPPQVRAVCVNAVPVVQIEPVVAAPLGAGTGQPDQAVHLDTTGLVDPLCGRKGPPLEVLVAGDRWQQRRDLSSSGPDDPHYVVRPDHLLFGNGVNGRCPPLGAVIEHTGLARTAGARGNLRPGLSWTVPALEAAGIGYGTNRHALAGGRDPTRAEELVVAARQAATRHGALVTDDDLRSAAYELPGMAVARAEVVPRFDRRIPDRPADGVRTLVVLPHATAREVVSAGADATVVPAEYLRAVAQRLRGRRVLGERLVVQGPVLVAVDVWLLVTVQPWTLAAEVQAAVESALRVRLSPVPRSDVVPPWPLGRDLTTQDVMALAASVAGVATVLEVRVAPSGVGLGDGPVRVPPDGLVVAGHVEVGCAGDGAAGDGPAGGGTGRTRRGVA